jgi:regulator of protease activity HflC (stomatin/prohibitin superfamily)
LQEIYIDLFDRLDEELMKALSSDIKKWAPGIEILSVRVTKPTIPKKILQNVEEMEKIKVEYLIAIERERTAVEERRTNQSQAKIKAEADLSVKRIELGKLLDRKKNELKMGKIEADIIVEREKSRVNAEFLAAFA